MSVQQDLLDLGDLFNFCDLSTFTQNIPIEWVASALDLFSQATIRRRRLPADQVLWLVLGKALFRDEPVHEVAHWQCHMLVNGQWSMVNGQLRGVHSG